MMTSTSASRLAAASKGSEDVAVIHGDAPAFSSSESGGEDEPLFVDQDDAQSIFQPALSPVATRLTSPKTSAAEKAAAMETLPGGGLFSVIESSTSGGESSSGTGGSTTASTIITRRRAKTTAMTTTTTTTTTTTSTAHRQTSRDVTLKPFTPQLMRPPSPWRSRPKEPPQSMSSVWGQTRHHRSSSEKGDALRRIREALPSVSMPSMSMPSINLPSNLFSGLTSPTFFSGSSSPRHQTTTDGTTESQPSNAGPRPPSVRSTRPRMIRRSTSDESVLYHSLSRMSSLGDDERWGHIREQTNSRLKAITDSWDRPTFKLPNFLPAPLKRTSIFGSESNADTVRSPAMASTGSFTKDGTLSDIDRALESLTGDIVIMGGYRGSVLRSTKTNRQVWVPVKVGLNIRKVNLEVGLDPEDEEKMEEKIYASGMLQNIGPVDISRRLFKRLRECDNAKSGKLRVWDYGWDWRLSPHLLSGKLIAYLEKLPSNQEGVPASERGVTVIAHSLGGLITRHAVNQRPELFAGVIYAGTPQTCINILGPFRNGDAVLLNEKVLTAQVHFSLRTSFAFLPEDGFCFINKHTGESFPVDFYDAEEWVKYALSPCAAPALPAYNSRSSAFESLLNLSSSLPNLPLRGRGNSAPPEPQSVRYIRQYIADAARKVEDRTLAPQMGNEVRSSQHQQQQLQNGASSPAEIATKQQYREYLKRTLSNTRQFRAELAHNPERTANNEYPPLAVIYGKDIPTVYAAHVTCRDAIACADAYDDLVFRSGDGVVLAREAMVPDGYDVVRGGRISTDRGHITMLGDLNAVGRALEAVVKGRRKGIGLRVPIQRGSVTGEEALMTYGDA